MTDDLDDLLKELKQSQGSSIVKPSEPSPKIEINEESANQYIMDNAAKLIETGLKSVEALKDVIAQSYDAKEIEAYAILIKSVADSMDTINKINITNKKIKASKEIKTMEIDARKQLGPNTTTNNVLIATREEIIKGLIAAANEPKSEKIIDVTE